MVEVEIRVQSYNEETQQIEWDVRALVRADGGGLDVYGDRSIVPDDPVLSITTGKQIHSADDPDEWARNLPYAYRSGNPVAVIRHDDDPPNIEEPELAANEPAIPEPPVPDFGEHEATDPAEAVGC
jgi:hypothetical protein